MGLNEKLDAVFAQFISNTVSNDLLKLIRDSVTAADVDTLMRKVESLDDPSAYCNNDFDSETPAGFFRFIDFISALIINLGAPAIEEMKKFGNTSHHFLPWVIKYADDSRFHPEIMSKFSVLFDK